MKPQTPMFARTVHANVLLLIRLSFGFITHQKSINGVEFVAYCQSRPTGFQILPNQFYSVPILFRTPHRSFLFQRVKSFWEGGFQTPLRDWTYLNPFHQPWMTENGCDRVRNGQIWVFRQIAACPLIYSSGC